ncbi:MAG: hypothetical protein HYV61_11375 [Candidatus Rokubacteria bacterium]|nr:hypothetical protein [Candidatus Rokubacteria bacterium]MBI2879086.1 hypothetical protein [Candidatus Rokubacteria bacterium]
MPHLLHLLKAPPSGQVLEILSRQAQDPDCRLSVVLMQEAAGTTLPLQAEIYRLDDGATASPYPAISHARLLELIFAADSVVAW